MTHGISTEDISNLAMIWTDDEDVSVQHAAVPLGSAHAADTHYKTIWSCGTEQVCNIATQYIKEIIFSSIYWLNLFG